MIFFLVHPRTGQIAVAINTGICHVGGDAKLLLQPVEIVVCHKLRFPVRDACVAGGVEISVVKVHMVESEIIPEWMDMHLADTFRIVPGACKLGRKGMGVVPRYIVFVSHAPVMGLFHAGMKSCSGCNTAWTGAVGPVKGYPFAARESRYGVLTSGGPA